MVDRKMVAINVQLPITGLSELKEKLERLGDGVDELKALILDIESTTLSVAIEEPEE